CIDDSRPLRLVDHVEMQPIERNGLLELRPVSPCLVELRSTVEKCPKCPPRNYPRPAFIDQDHGHQNPIRPISLRAAPATPFRWKWCPTPHSRGRALSRTKWKWCPTPPSRGRALSRAKCVKCVQLPRRRPREIVFGADERPASPLRLEAFGLRAR